MPNDPATSPEERHMVTFDAIAPDGTRERLRFGDLVLGLIAR